MEHSVEKYPVSYQGSEEAVWAAGLLVWPHVWVLVVQHASTRLVRCKDKHELHPTQCHTITGTGTNISSQNTITIYCDYIDSYVTSLSIAIVNDKVVYSLLF